MAALAYEGEAMNKKEIAEAQRFIDTPITEENVNVLPVPVFPEKEEEEETE